MGFLITIFQFFNSAHNVIKDITIIVNNSNVNHAIPFVLHVTKGEIQIVLAVIQIILRYFSTLSPHSVLPPVPMDTMHLLQIIHAKCVILTALHVLGDLVLIV